MAGLNPYMKLERGVSHWDIAQTLDAAGFPDWAAQWRKGRVMVINQSEPIGEREPGGIISPEDVASLQVILGNKRGAYWTRVAAALATRPGIQDPLPLWQPTGAGDPGTDSPRHRMPPGQVEFEYERERLSLHYPSAAKQRSVIAAAKKLIKSKPPK